MAESEPVKILVHDTRVGGKKKKSPAGQFHAILRIDTKDPLDLVLNWIKLQCDRFDYIDELHLYAHGYARGGQMGFGVQFGANDITLNNVHQWSFIAGYVEEMYLLACGAADDTSSEDDGEGDGMALCSQLASYSSTWLKASPDTQLFDTGFVGEVNFGPWEGRVYTWDPNGVRQ